MIKRALTRIRNTARHNQIGGLIYYSEEPWDKSELFFIKQRANEVGSVRNYQDIVLEPLPYESGRGYPLHVHGINNVMIREIMNKAGYSQKGRR